MQKAMRINEFWRWLPAFRVVAETQQLRTAAKILHVSPSAVSRTIRLVEDSLGTTLFHRQGRKIRLNTSGELLLQTVRSAMRLMDEGLTRATSGQYTGTVKVRAPDPLFSRIGRALHKVQQEHPDLVGHLIRCPQSEVNARLLRGEIDLALLDTPLREAQIEVGHIATLQRGIYCGIPHPLSAKRRPSIETILEHPFATVDPEESHMSQDGWPLELDRRIALFSSDWYTILHQCLTGKALVVFEDLLVSEWVERKQLKRFSLEQVADRSVFFARRTSLIEKDLADLVIDAIGHELNEPVS
jgi:DNA-binding transcriptional LysR family regulator